MPFLSKLLSFWRNLFRIDQVEQDLDDKLQSYMEELAERKVHTGLDPEAAREAALMEVGGIERIKNLVRQQRIAFSGLRGLAFTALIAVTAFNSGALAASGFQHRPADYATAPSRQKTADGPVKAAPEGRHAVVLKGRLVDDKTGQPIAGVELGLEPYPTSRRFTYTDEDGMFSFSNPPSAGYRLTAGDQKWSVGGADSTGIHTPVSPNDHFLLNSPTAISVLTKDGQKQECKLLWGAREFKNLNWNLPDIRQFNYLDSLLELRAAALKSRAHRDKPDESFTLEAAYFGGKNSGGQVPDEARPLK
jgi:hypothetical protein